MFQIYYEYNRDVKDVFVDKMIDYLLKKYFKSNIINKTIKFTFTKYKEHIS